MRIVDDETRRIVMENRIDALENDRLFETSKQEEQQILMLEEPSNNSDSFQPDQCSESESEPIPSQDDEAELKQFAGKQQKKKGRPPKKLRKTRN